MRTEGSLTIPQPAGLARRFGAIFTDVFVVGVALGIMAIPPLLGGWCARLGVFAQLIGLAAATLYTALFNSRIGGGQTLGKWAFGILVVGANGRPISFARSLGRSVVFWIAVAQPQRIRDIALQSESVAVVMVSLFLAVAFGLGILYLLLFNRETRQGLHDLIVGTFVVEKHGVPRVIPVPLPRVHRYVLAGLFVLTGVAMILETPSQRRQVFEFQRFEHQLRHIEAFQELRHFRESGKTLEIGVQLNRPPESFEAVQRQVAGIVLSAYPAADGIEQMKVTVACNCYLGIVSGRMMNWGVVLENSRNATLDDWRRDQRHKVH
jgi:uncharacterized RDD family membrane protein YckC